VQHLPPADVQRLSTAVLCLARAQKQSGVFLPTPVAWSILALCYAYCCTVPVGVTLQQDWIATRSFLQCQWPH
jgi:hypothetical protein